MAQESTPVYVGVDLHRDTFTACFMQPDGSFSYGVYHIKLHGLEQFSKRLGKHVSIAVETTTNTEFFASLFEGQVGKFVRVNTQQFTMLRNNLKKTDKNDSHALALYLRKDMLPESRKKTELERKVQDLCHLRERRSGQKTRELNSIHDMYVRNGMKLDKDDLSSMKKLKSLDLSSFDDTDRFKIEEHIAAVFFYDKQLKEIDRKIEALAVGLKNFKILVRFKGVGTFTGAVLASMIGDISDFSTKKKLCSYFGLVPRVYQSESTCRYGRITKRGNPLARKVLIQCAWVGIRYSPQLSDFYHRIKGRRGHKRAIVATARKMLDNIYDALTHGWCEDKAMRSATGAN